jgi:fatty acid desaturase
LAELTEEIKAKKAIDQELFHKFTAELREIGLLDKTPIRGMVEIFLELSGYALFFYFLGDVSPIVAGLFWVLLTVRSTYIVHDLLHKQYFSRKTGNKLGLIFGNLTLGLSGKWWDREHNVMHHTYCNSAEKDTDVQGFGGAIIGRHDSLKFLHRHQHHVFFTMLPAIYISFFIQSVIFVFEKKNWTELLFLVFHFLLPAYVFYALPLGDAGIVVAIHYVGYGFALAMVTITNHIGLPILFGDDYKKLSWMDIQTKGSRNVNGGAIIHYIYGGLNTQIEHHVFPHASRFELLKIAPHLEKFCKDNGFIYYSTSPAKAYSEIYTYLKDLRLQD